RRSRNYGEVSVMNAGTITGTHAETTRMDIHEVARQLVANLGPTLVATLANVKDRKLPNRWAKADGTTPRPENEARLRTAHRAWSAISLAEGPSIARSWFIGANPRLQETAPMFALRDDRHAEVLAAAAAFAEGTEN